jgi:acyl-homoserine lactone acylase PvdQ
MRLVGGAARAGVAALAAALACAGGAALLPAGAAAQTPLPPYVQPYGYDDAGGFYNVLPPGEAGADNALQFGQYTATGALPPHFDDQQPLYQNLLYAAPALTTAQIPDYFKDATFGVRTGDMASVEQPAAGVTIVRDRYDVPHIYGQTRGDVEFGAGYAAAEDRLFLMDVLRHVAEASLSSFIGGSPGDQAMDEAQWTVAPYTQADLQQQISQDTALYGAAGQQVVADVDSFVAGINAFVQKATIDPQLLPAEYAAIHQLPGRWTPEDVLAEASLIGAIFGKGGGNEVNSALTYEAFVKRFGPRAGRRDWENFREANDPEAPTTVSRPFPYETGSPFARRGLAMPVPGSVSYVAPGQTNPDTAQIRRPARLPLGAPASERAAVRSGVLPRPLAAPGGWHGPILGYTDTPDPIPIPDDGSLGSMLLEDLYGSHPLASNWELVNAAHSSNGHAIAVMGPQVGYYIPEILMEEDLHGPGFDARGASFPGVNLYVELGHGPDYAWSATTATSDNVDTFAEVLCNPSGGPVSPDSTYYLYRGRCTAMQQLTRTNSWTTNADYTGPPGSATISIYRTVHGPVFARGRVGRRYVAFATDRTTYFHEADSALGFSELNDPSFLTGPRRFQQAAFKINFGFNWAYVDANHIAYFESGWFPERAPGTSPDFPILGTGPFDWRGTNNALHTETDIPFAAHPQAIDPTYLVSWNNKQAPRWAAADDNYGYGPLYRMQLIRDHIVDDLRAGHGKINIAQLTQAMELAATEDIRIVKLWPIIRQVLGRPRNARLRSAIAQLNAWYAAGGHRWDLTKAGTYANNAAIELMDAWWPKLLRAEFAPTLGPTVFGALQGMLGFGAVVTGTQPNEPDFAQGWYGYVSKDLRDLLHQHNHRRHRRPAGAYSRIYCGRGSFRRCQGVLRRSLLAAMSVSPQAMYGYGNCAGNPQPSCYDQNEWTDVSAISLPPFPFQNRPTFQQVVELTRTLPR